MAISFDGGDASRKAPAPPSFVRFDLAGARADLADPNRAIINPLADAVWFYLAPLWALALVLIGSQTFLWPTREFSDFQHGYLSFFIGAMTSGHLLTVVFRSHFNREVFARWPLRFTLVPLVLWAGMTFNMWIMVTVGVIAVFWDVYHSGMQNFGLARIFDARAGNAPREGRWLDSMISQVLYAGPIAGGATLAFHIGSFEGFSNLSGQGIGGIIAAAFTTVPQAVEGQVQLLRWIVIGGSLAAWTVYVLGYVALWRKGYRIAPQKVLLLSATTLTSIIAWGFNPFATGFAIMNLFHAVQYFAIVWSREGGNLSRLFKLGAIGGKWAALVLILTVSMSFGFWQMAANFGWDGLYAFGMTVCVMHFWYDGFIWSVTKSQV